MKKNLFISILAVILCVFSPLNAFAANAASFASSEEVCDVSSSDKDYRNPSNHTSKITTVTGAEYTEYSAPEVTTVTNDYSQTVTTSTTAISSTHSLDTTTATLLATDEISTYTVPYESGIDYGDVYEKGGGCNEDDVLEIQRYAVGLAADIDEKAADANVDGEVNVLDAAAVRCFLNGESDHLPNNIRDSKWDYSAELLLNPYEESCFSYPGEYITVNYCISGKSAVQQADGISGKIESDGPFELDLINDFSEACNAQVIGNTENGKFSIVSGNNTNNDAVLLSFRVYIPQNCPDGIYNINITDIIAGNSSGQKVAADSGAMTVYVGSVNTTVTTTYTTTFTTTVSSSRQITTNTTITSMTPITTRTEAEKPEKLIMYCSVSCSDTPGKLMISGKTQGTERLDEIGICDITVLRSSDGKNWISEFRIDNITKEDSPLCVLDRYEVTVTGGFYYKVSCSHYAKKNSFSQNIENSSAYVWVDEAAPSSENIVNMSIPINESNDGIQNTLVSEIPKQSSAEYNLAEKYDTSPKTGDNGVVSAVFTLSGALCLAVTFRKKQK